MDCSELSRDEELALASAISDELNGVAVALVSDERILIDQFTGAPMAVEDLEKMVKAFIGKRKDASHYSTEVSGSEVKVRSPDPIRALRRGAGLELPPNLMKCPFCPFVTPYEELLTVHSRSHGFF